jgi:hypothetical protein
MVLSITVIYKKHMVVYILGLFHWLWVFPARWCQDACTVHPAEVRIPLKITNDQGDDVEIMDCPTSILWPWDFFSWMWEAGCLLQWVADDPTTASNQTEQYWKHCSHLDFYKRLDLQDDQLGSTIPLFFHADGVKIYKAQKAWVYSISSACRKGGSLKTKLVVIILRENRVIKEKSHDAVGKLMGYVTDTLMSGCFPQLGPDGNPFPPGSQEEQRAGQLYAGGWCAAFAGFKGDWEARVVIHKSKRSYNSTWICDHCMASRLPDFTFGDFNMDANCLNHRFTHEEYMILQGEKQSSWRFVKGWTKDRNLEDLDHSSTVFFFGV